MTIWLIQFSCILAAFYVIGRIVEGSFVKVLAALGLLVTEAAFIFFSMLMVLFFIPFGRPFKASQMILPVLLLMLITGIAVYAIQRKFAPIKLDLRDIEIAEYLIQWTTIYLTVYQLVFNELRSVLDELATRESVQEAFRIALSPDNINIALLPPLFAVWVALAMRKLAPQHNHTEKIDKAAKTTKATKATKAEES